MLCDKPSEVRGPVAIITMPSGGDVENFSANQGESGKGVEAVFNELGEGLAINGQCPSRWNGSFIRRFHDQGIHPAHLFLQQTRCIVRDVGAERIAADQFRKGTGAVGWREFFPASSRTG